MSNLSESSERGDHLLKVAVSDPDTGRLVHHEFNEACRYLCIAWLLETLSYALEISKDNMHPPLTEAGLCPWRLA